MIFFVESFNTYHTIPNSMVRVTPELKEKMIAMRKGGATYSQITATYGVKKERCMAYLKHIPLHPSLVSAVADEWLHAESEGKAILKDMGFDSVHDLNSVCSPQSCWDYLASKDGLWWLIDVTVNGQKGVPAKRGSLITGYKHAILLKTGLKWQLIEFAMDVRMTVEEKSVPEMVCQSLKHVSITDTKKED